MLPQPVRLHTSACMLLSRQRVVSQGAVSPSTCSAVATTLPIWLRSSSTSRHALSTQGNHTPHCRVPPSRVHVVFRCYVAPLACCLFFVSQDFECVKFCCLLSQSILFLAQQSAGSSMAYGAAVGSSGMPCGLAVSLVNTAACCSWPSAAAYA